MSTEPFRNMMSEFRTIAKTGEIPPGEARTYPVGDVLVAVFFVGGEYFAINDACPHMGASLAEGYLEGEAVTCPWHAWRFCVKDGTWLDSPKSRLKATPYELRIVGDEIQIRLDAPAG